MESPSSPQTKAEILLSRIFSVNAWVEDAGSFALDAFAGSIGSIAGVYIGSPFDVIKTRMQRLGGSQSIVSAAKAMLRSEGPGTFFRGAFVSSLGAAPNNAVTFGVSGWATKTMNLVNPVPPEDGISFLNIFLAGSWAGFSQSLVLSPFELVKVQQQIHQKDSPNFFDTAKDIIRQGGVRRGLMRGWVATALRDGPTFGFYFLSFDLCKWLWMKNNEAKKPQPHSLHELGEEASLLLHTQAPNVPSWVVLAGGALAGISSWSLALPMDCIKSVIQGSPLNTPASELRFFTVAKRIIKDSGGVHGLFRGWKPCLLRAAPVNAVTFLVYDAILRAAAGTSFSASSPAKKGEGGTQLA